jgi:hypothetical protein
MWFALLGDQGSDDEPDGKLAEDPDPGPPPTPSSARSSPDARSAPGQA